MKIVKVPLSERSLGKNLGCNKGPDAIVNMLAENIWSKEDGSQIVFEIDEASEDLDSAEGDIFIGGDHSITHPLFKGFAKNFDNPGLIVFDAHPDVYENEKELSHQDWVKFLIDGGVLKPENVVLVGIRAADPSEFKWLDNKKIKYFTAADVYGHVEDVCEKLVKFSEKLDGLYLSIDIDVLDPAFAPGTGYREPGGLSTRELLYFVKEIKNLKNLKRSDLVEVNPEIDTDEMTVKIAAKIVGELL
ncbi:MAG: arginase family protein [Candidatus Nanoarchaeia archaeon]|nr:arginase family protein [Candidatus Nanoarchaeia archaeon]